MSQTLTEEEEKTIARAEKGLLDYENEVIAIDWNRAKNIRIQAKHEFIDQSGQPKVEQFDSSVLDFWNNQLQRYRDGHRRGTEAQKFLAAQNFLYAFDTVKNDGLWVHGNATKNLFDAKDKEIAELKAKIAEQARRFSDLQTELNIGYARIRFLEETLTKHHISFGSEKGVVS